MKKRILVFAAILTLSLGIMTACGSKDTNNSATSPSGNADSSANPEASGDNVIDDAVDGTGDVIKGAGDAVKDATDDITNGVEDATKDTTRNR